MRRTTSLGVFLVVSLLAGVLVAGLAIPVAALTGVASTTVSTSLLKLPENLLVTPQAEGSEILLKNGQLLVKVFDENRVIVPLDQVAPIMQQAQIAIEDDRYYDHGALDFKSLVKAVVTNIGSDGGGGSTLTQQYVKQVQIEQVMMTIKDQEERDAALKAITERTLKRKIQEMRYAIYVETQLSKSQILENYLNIAYYGAGAYGVEAAAHRYFNTTAAKLTLSQAAMLAGIVQTPARNPIDDPQGALERRDTVLNRMLELELITKAEATAAKAEGYDPVQSQPIPNGCANVADTAYVQICSWVMEVLMDNRAMGDTPEDVMDNLRRGGYTIQTYIDPTIQHAAQDAVSGLIADTDPVKAVMVMMDPGTGIVLGAAQNRREYPGAGTSNENTLAGKTSLIYFAPYGQGIDEGSQAGSTFKAFVVAAALEKGIPPTKVINAPPSRTFPIQTDFTACDGPARAFGQPWKVSNSSGAGVMSMYTAAAQSVNTYFAELERLVGLCDTVTMAEAVGLVTDPTDTELPNVMAYQHVPSFVLGSADTSPMSMAVAYSTFAARGVRCDPVIVQSITDQSGNPVDTPNGNCHQAMRPEVADGVNAVLNNAFSSRFSGTAQFVSRPAGYDLSGKTGTTDESKAVWLIGYTPEIVGVAMIAIDRNPVWDPTWETYGQSLSGLPLANTTLVGFGANDAGRIWSAAMNQVLPLYPATEFTPPNSDILYGRKAPVPGTAGMSADQAKATLENAGFFVTSQEIFNDQPAGTYLSVSCDGTYGGTCTQIFSKGPREPVKPTTAPTSGATGGPTGGATRPPPVNQNGNGPR